MIDKLGLYRFKPISKFDDRFSGMSSDYIVIIRTSIGLYAGYFDDNEFYPNEYSGWCEGLSLGEVEPSAKILEFMVIK